MKQALLVIDAQNIYTDSKSELFIEKSDLAIKNINSLIEYFTKINQPIIYIRHINSADGKNVGRMYDFAGEPEETDFVEDTFEVEYDNRLVISSNQMEIIKNRYDAFIGTDLDKILKQNKINKVVVCGFMANFCCESTARSAHDRDYFVDFIKDATGVLEFDSDMLSSTCETLENGFAKVLTTQEFLGKN